MTREEIREVVLATLKELGLADRVISQREAERTRWYSVTEINAYEAQQRALARIQLDTIITKS